jgi:20S proteasome alpha/beta subunit
MTAIIGMLQQDGIVLAAESEEVAQLKRSVFKIPLFTNPRGERLVVGGAGSTPMIESVTQKLRDCFKTLAHKDSVHLRQLFETIIFDFYSNHVLSWPSREERQENDFSLLMGLASDFPARNGDKFHLWISQSGTLRDVSRSSAIGSGADLANALLDDYAGLYAPEVALFVAVHILTRVKRTQPWCGKETSVWILNERHANQIFLPFIERLEALSAKLDFEYDRKLFSVASLPSQKKKGRIDILQETEIASTMKEMRAEFRTVVREIQELYRYVREESMPSDSQKAEGQP